MPDNLPVAVGNSLHQGLAALGLEAGLAAPLLTYLALLQRWNRACNLTAVRDPQAMVTHHLLDSLTLVPYLADLQTLADLGTGPGLPGIPLALARPGLQVSLIESNGKKARFLREVVRTLNLDHVEVIAARIEAIHVPVPFAAMTARALTTLARMLTLGGHLLASDGRALAMKGTIPDAEIAALPPGWEVEAIHRLNVPGLDAARHLIVITRTLSVNPG